MIWSTLLALSFSCQQCESVEKPKISSTTHKVFHVKQEDRSVFDESDRYLATDAGKTVVLTCEVGEGLEVNWTTPSDSLDQERVRRRNNKLTIRNSLYSDTGGYSCRLISLSKISPLSTDCNHYSRSVGGRLTDTVHLYIRDEQNFFVEPDHFLQSNVYTESSSPTRVGCQATDPRATFRLENINMEDITDSLGEAQLAWSHQTGLWVIRGNLEFHAGVLICSLSLPGGSTRQQRLTINLIKPPDLTPPR